MRARKRSKRRQRRLCVQRWVHGAQRRHVHGVRGRQVQERNGARSMHSMSCQLRVACRFVRPLFVAAPALPAPPTLRLLPVCVAHYHIITSYVSVRLHMPVCGKLSQHIITSQVTSSPHARCVSPRCVWSHTHICACVCVCVCVCVCERARASASTHIYVIYARYMQTHEHTWTCMHTQHTHTYALTYIHIHT